MKILLVDKEEELKIGGVKMYTNRLYDFLKKRGHTVHIARFTNNPPENKHIIPIPYYISEKRSYIYVPSEKTFSMFRNILNSLKPNIVYKSLGISPFDFFIPSLCHEADVPIVGVWHADFNWEKGSYQLLAKSIFLAYLPYCRQLDLLHVFSEKMSEFYQRRGIPEERILVLPNGINTKFYSPGKSSFAKEYNIKRGILFLGRLTLQKNPEILIRSFLNLNTPKTTKLVLVGYGDLEENLKTQYTDERIIFTGAVLDEYKKRDIIRSCQIFALPSRFEGLPLALLESMSSALACIASDAGSNVETLSNAGILIPNNSLKYQLPLALKLLIEYPDFQEILGKKARKKALNDHNEEKILKALEKALEKVNKNFRLKGPPQVKPLPIEILRRNIKSLSKYLQFSLT